MASEIYAAWRAAGIVAAVRVNPLEGEGRADLAEIMRGRPDVVIMSKVAEPETCYGTRRGSGAARTTLRYSCRQYRACPEIELARGIMQTYGIARASPRVTVSGSTEDVAADLGAPRSKTAIELAYARQRLHLECTAANVLSVDCPYTFADLDGCEADACYARQWAMSPKVQLILITPASLIG